MELQNLGNRLSSSISLKVFHIGAQVGWRVFYALDGKVTKLTDFELQSFEVTGYAN